MDWFRMNGLMIETIFDSSSHIASGHPAVWRGFGL